ncbi:MAG: hypothetical protein ACTSP4_06335 [Candidatus Hodarchaeales archaeon]
MAMLTVIAPPSNKYRGNKSNVPPAKSILTGEDAEYSNVDDPLNPWNFHQDDGKEHLADD